ncbi:hypothetical protein TKK_0000895 [Trichogramma kaykai]
MSTAMGIPVVFGNNNNNNNNNNGEQLMLLRTLQDNEHNIIGNNNRVVVTTATSQPANNNSSTKGGGNVSVIQSQRKSSEKSSSNNNNNNNNGKRKIVVVDEPLPPYDPARLKKHGKNGQPPPIAVAKRNARERNRVKQVNNGFATLRQHIPSQLAQGYGDRGKKLSKVETLRMAVEYIRGLQRLLAEADGLDPNQQQQQLMSIEQSAQQIMIPSPCGSVYSQNGGGQHNGSAEQLLGLDESQQQQQHGLGELEDNSGLDDGAGPDAYGSLMEDEDELDARRDVKRFKLDAPIQNRLSDNNGQQKVIFRRNRLASADTATSVLYLSKQSFIVGDEENIEPLPNRNNNNNNLLPAFSTSLLLPQQQQHQTLTSHVKRELRLDEEDEEDELRSNEDDSGIMLTTSTSPYSATEILVENPETGRLVPLKIEAHHQQHEQLLQHQLQQQQQQHHHQHETAAQLVYVEGLPAAVYYRHELEAVANGSELMDAVNWWEPVDHHQTTNGSNNTSTTRGLSQLSNPQQQQHHHRLAHV